MDNIDAPTFFDFTRPPNEHEHLSDDWFFSHDGFGDDNDSEVSEESSTTRLLRSSGKKEPPVVAKGPQKGVECEYAEEGHRQRDGCPSPKKKLRTDVVCEDSVMSPTPRRSPRRQPKAAALPNKYKTSEQLELEKIAAMRQELNKSRKKHEVTYKKAIAKGVPVTMKSSQPPTLPQEFHFRSDQRIKGTAEVAESTSITNFAKTLRSAMPNVEPNKSNKSRPTTTRPKPFNLASTKSCASLSSVDKYMSTAEKVNAYKNHFRSATNLHGTGKPSSNTRRPQSPGLTVAKTPNLSTRGRSRSLKHLTREEEEEQDFEEHKKQQFKAHPVNHRIFKDQVGVPKIPSKPPTEVQEFNLHGPSSHTMKISKTATEEEVTEFRAQGVNRKILEGPVGVKPAEKKALTMAQSPAFSLRLRSRERLHEEVTTSQPAQVIKIPKHKPVAHMGVPFRPQLEHKFTVPEPFVVEQHSKEMLKKKEKKIQQVLEDERKAREFHAGLLPSDSPDQLPAKKTRPVTAVEPFNLAADERGNKYKEQWKSKIEEEKEQARMRAQFHASSNKTIFKTPFVPEKSNRPLTEMSSFTLNTDQRAVKRENYNQQVKAHEAEIEAIKRQKQERKEKEENEAVAQLRQEMVHKATGIKKYKQVELQPSEKPLTEAQSPFLQTHRLRSRRMSE